MSSSPDARRGEPAPDGDDVVARLVTTLRLKHPWVHLAILVVLAVLAAVCLAATLTRLSPLPLLPLAPLALAGFAAWRARGSQEDRQLLGWLSMLALAVAVAFWLLATVGRNLS